MAAKKSGKKTARGLAQDRARVAGGQKYEVDYEAKKTGRTAPAVKKAVKKVGNIRGKVEKNLARKRYPPATRLSGRRLPDRTWEAGETHREAALAAIRRSIAWRSICA